MSDDRPLDASDIVFKPVSGAGLKMVVYYQVDVVRDWRRLWLRKRERSVLLGWKHLED